MNPVEKLSESLSEIDTLVSLPNQMRDSAVAALRDVQNKKWVVAAGSDLLERHVQSLEQIRETSFANEYAIIYNQLCVLAVSILSASLESFFVEYITAHPENIRWEEKIDKKSINFNISRNELSSHGYDVSGKLGELVRDNISWLNFKVSRPPKMPLLSHAVSLRKLPQTWKGLLFSMKTAGT